MELELKRPNRARIRERQRASRGADIPLGTADWHEFPRGHNPTFSPGDIFVGRTLDGHSIGIKDDGHVSVVAKTRSGKGTDIIIPNLLHWPGSVIDIGVKGENAILTARRRGHGSRFAQGLGQKVYIIDPFGEVHSGGYGDDFSDLKASFNPLDMLGTHRPESVDDAARIASGVIETEASVDPFWNESARTFIQFGCLHVCSGQEFKDEERNLLTVRDLILEGYAELRSFLADNLDPASMPSAYSLLFRAMRKNKHFGGEVAKAGEKFARMHGNAPRMLESIAQVACTALDFLASDAMKAAVRSSNFSLSELKTDPRGVSVFICLPQRFMQTHVGFFRMMIALLIAEMERVRHQPKSGYPILMVMDEFAALKRMSMIEHAAAQIAGFDVKMMFVVQTLGQLKDVYKDNWEFVLGNASTRIFFGNDDPLTRETVSKLIGDTETVRTTRSSSASHGTSNTLSTGQSIGQSGSRTHGHTSSWSMGGQGSSWSTSSSSSQTSGNSHTHSHNAAFANNASETAGTNEAIHKRALVTPDEIGRFFSNADDPMALVLLSGEQPLAVRRVSYYKDDDFRGLYDPHPDHPVPMTRQQVQELRMWQRRALARQEQERKQAEEKRQREAEVRRRREAHRKDQMFLAEMNRKADLARQAYFDRFEEARAWKRFVGAILLMPPIFITGFACLIAFKKDTPVLAQVIKTWSSLLGLG